MTAVCMARNLKRSALHISALAFQQCAAALLARPIPCIAFPCHAYMSGISVSIGLLQETTRACAACANMSWQPRSPQPYPGRSHTSDTRSSAAAANGVQQPLLDKSEVVRSPNAAAGRAATAFSPDAPVTNDTFRLRAKPTLPVTAPSASNAGSNGAADARSLYHNSGLSIRTSLTPRTGKGGLLATPVARRFRGATYATLRLLAAAIVIVLLAIIILIRRTFSPDRALARTLAACVPAYPTLQSAASGGGLPGAQSNAKIARPAIAMVTMHDSRKTAVNAELAAMTGVRGNLLAKTAKVSTSKKAACPDCTQVKTSDVKA